LSFLILSLTFGGVQERCPAPLQVQLLLLRDNRPNIDRKRQEIANPYR
jgi:hypothetical protein